MTTAELIDAEIDSLSTSPVCRLASVVAGARTLTRFVPAFMTT